jgi:ornithine carbamoyltransferase
MNAMRKVIIMGAGGRDFHDFNVVYRDDPQTDVVAFTAAQIPGIDDRTYPASLAGERYPKGIPIRPESELTYLIRNHGVDEVVLAYSDLSHEDVMHKASIVGAAIVVRTFKQETVGEIAEHARVPVINALTDRHHPCQALADLLTLRERFGELRGLRLAYVGDSDNVTRSLMEASALAGMDIVVASPAAYEPDEPSMRAVSEFVGAHHGHVTVVHDPREAVTDADAVYTDVWVSMGAEGDTDRRLRELRPYQVTPALMALAKPHAVFMHCLPAHRGQEVDAAVIDGPASIVWQQAANRLPTEQAVVYALVTGSWGSR